jgi:rare lipoprotein A
MTRYRPIDKVRRPWASARRLAFALAAAASLAACAQSPAGRQKADLAGASRQAASERPHKVHLASLPPVNGAPRPAGATGDKPAAAHGVASFYSETETASGETFDRNAMTAAHPTLPFGTRLRVTDVSSGRFVTVRVNDRGPFVPGRVVDISPSAAEALGMVDKGVANVRLDVVR